MCRLITGGIPQGSVLSTVLYNIYVNDIFYVYPNAKCVLYADDTAIILSGKTVHDLSNAANELFHTFSVWFCDNLLALTANKTNYIVFGSKNSIKNFPTYLKFHIHAVLKTDIIRFLGIFIDNQLNWSENCSVVKSKIGLGLALMRKCYLLPKSCRLSLYYAYIYPHLTYGIEFWGCSHNLFLHPILVIQKQCICIIGHVNKYTHCAPIASVNKILFLEDVFKLVILFLMFKVYHMQCSQVLQSLFIKTNVSHMHSMRSRTIFMLNVAS